MTTIALRAPGAINTFLHKLSEGAYDFIEGIREANAIAARYEALSRLSDEQLARHGLTRADIPQFALRNRKPV
jgi:hypothetical protein